MNWDYAKDNRTEEQVSEDWKVGKYNEPLIVKNLGFPYFKVDGADEYKFISNYQPDYFISLDMVWYPAEVKFTKVELDYVELKKNQADILSKINGIYIQATPTKYVILGATFMVKQEEVIGYCNKPCYKHTPKKWIGWDNNIDFKI